MLVTTTIVMLLFKHKIIKKKIMRKETKEETKERCTYLRVDLTHTYHTISRKEEGDLYMYTHI